MAFTNQLRESEHLTRVTCNLSDCLFYRKKPSEPGATFCGHPEKPMNTGQKSCSLYRMDWEKKQEKFG